MKETIDIAPLVDLAEQEFQRLHRDALDTITALGVFWTKLYGPNEMTEPLFEILGTVSDTFYEYQEE